MLHTELKGVFNVTLLLVPNLRCRRSPISELDLCQYTYHTEEEFAVGNFPALYGQGPRGTAQKRLAGSVEAELTPLFSPHLQPRREDEVGCQVWLFHGQTVAVSRVAMLPLTHGLSLATPLGFGQHFSSSELLHHICQHLA